MSTIVQSPPNKAPSVPLSSKKPLIKPDPNPPEEEDDTEVLLEKVRAKIEDIKRRQSIGLGPPPLELRRSHSPTKQDAEALFWGSDSVTSTKIDQTGNKGNTGMDRSHEDEVMDDDDVEGQEVIRQTTLVKSLNPTGMKHPPQTPRMDGLKGLFANPKAVPPTPLMGGIRQLFNEPVEPRTPVYGGVRDIFKSTVAPTVPETPVLEGVKDLLNTPAVYRKPLPPPEPAEVSIDTVVTDSGTVIPGAKAASTMRRRKVAAGVNQLIEEPVLPTTGITQPLKIGRPKKALKVSYSNGFPSSPDVDKQSQEAVSLPRPTKTEKATDEAVSSLSSEPSNHLPDADL